MANGKYVIRETPRSSELPPISSLTLLTEVLNVPVGIINCSWGGSTVEGWLPKDILRNYSDIDLSLAGNDEKIHPMLQPMIMYNGMLKPASKYTVRGFLWYQGESNVGHPGLR